MGYCEGNVLYFREGTLLVEICGKEPRRWTRHCEVTPLGSVSCSYIPTNQFFLLVFVRTLVVNTTTGLSPLVEPVSSLSSYCTVRRPAGGATANLRIGTVRNRSNCQHCCRLSTSKTVATAERCWMKTELLKYDF